MSGRFLTFEGGEGAGKSTQIRLLADRLRAAGADVLLTREPGGTPGAEEIRQLLVSGAAGRWTRTTDTLLFMAARADHVARLVRPALDAGKTVLCDRYVHSTFAYQGGDTLTREMLSDLHDLATGALWPDLVLWLDLPAAEGLRRAHGRGGAEARFEENGVAFHEGVRESFAHSAAADPRVRRIDARRPVSEVSAAVWAEVAAHWPALQAARG